MHDRLLDNQNLLTFGDLAHHAEQLKLNVERFTNQLQDHSGAARVAEDVDSADLSGVSGTPTFFINGRRHYGAYDIETLKDEVRTARARALVAA
jgi:protein-disulfide isomerase